MDWSAVGSAIGHYTQMAAAGGLGWIVTRYLILPSKVEALKDDVTYLRDKVDDVYDFLIKSPRA